MLTEKMPIAILLGQKTAKTLGQMMWLLLKVPYFDSTKILLPKIFWTKKESQNHDRKKIITFC